MMANQNVEFRGKVDLIYPLRFPDSVEFLTMIRLANQNQNIHLPQASRAIAVSSSNKEKCYYQMVFEDQSQVAKCLGTGPEVHYHGINCSTTTVTYMELTILRRLMRHGDKFQSIAGDRLCLPPLSLTYEHVYYLTIF